MGSFQGGVGDKDGSLRITEELPIMPPMNAINLIRFREIHANGLIIEQVVWRLPEPVLGCTHYYKYRLYCGRDGVCWVRYDNERGKGDHRHVGGREEPYGFTGLDALLADFWNDVERLT